MAVEPLELLKIGAATYVVEFVDGLKDFSDDGTFRSLHGDIDYAAQELRVKEDQAEDAQRVTVLHEAVHAILHAAGQGEHDEALVVALGYGLYALLKDNPVLVAWLGLLPEASTDA